MKVGEVCARDVIIVGREESITTAAKLMRECHVGDVVVVEDGQKRQNPVGILTDRDIVVELISKDISLDSVSVGDAMSYDLLTIRDDDDTTEAIRQMRGKGVRRAPVVNSSGDLVGILAVDDVIDLLAEQLADIVGLIGREQKDERTTRK